MEPAGEGSELLRFLRGIGWYPGRRVNLSADLEEWEASDYSVPGIVHQWMSECGGLEFEYPRHSSVGGMHACVVSGALSTRRIHRALVAEYEEMIGGLLCPIGHSASGNLFLLMDSTGATYGGHDHFLGKVADDGYRALLAIWKREPLIRL
ncbi:SUKH-3 domain-containing protein [Kitasatospora phosalacinea]